MPGEAAAGSCFQLNLSGFTKESSNYRLDIYCMSCINVHWNREDHYKVYSCPQCRQSFTPRPDLVKSTVLTDLVEELKKPGHQAAPADHCYAGPEDVACDVCTGRKMKAVKSWLSCPASYCENHLQPHYDALPLKKHKLLDPSENLQQNICSRHDEVMKIFTELIRLLQERSSDVKQQIRSQQETEVSRVKDVQEKLQQEITELKRKDAELEQLSHTEDHTQFLLNYPSLPALSESTGSSSIIVGPLRYFEDVTAAVSELRDKLKDILTEDCGTVSCVISDVGVILARPDPMNRADFLEVLSFHL